MNKRKSNSGFSSLILNTAKALYLKILHFNIVYKTHSHK